MTVNGFPIQRAVAAITAAMNKERPIPRIQTSPLFELDDVAFDWHVPPPEFEALDGHTKARMVAQTIARGWRELVYTNSDKLEGMENQDAVV